MHALIAGVDVAVLNQNKPQIKETWCTVFFTLELAFASSIFIYSILCDVCLFWFSKKSISILFESLNCKLVQQCCKHRLPKAWRVNMPKNEHVNSLSCRSMRYTAPHRHNTFSHSAESKWTNAERACIITVDTWIGATHELRYRKRAENDFNCTKTKQLTLCNIWIRILMQNCTHAKPGHRIPWVYFISFYLGGACYIATFNAQIIIRSHVIIE